MMLVSGKLFSLATSMYGMVPQKIILLSTFCGIRALRGRPWNSSPTWIRKPQFSTKKSNDDTILSNEEYDEVVTDKEYQYFSDRLFRTPQHPHNVLVVQPYKRELKQRNSNTTPELQLEESIALINSLPQWKVIDAETVPLKSLRSADMFGSYNSGRLKEIVKSNKLISAVFVSINILTVKQLIDLESLFEVPCYDRYTIVIQIFRNHATTKEAKLQVSMAEIPYLKQCIKGLPKGFSDRLGRADLIGGSDRAFEETRRELLAAREKKLKLALSKLRHHRERLRVGNHKNNFPIIAIVGYTNAGKTSLIKALTGEEKMQPRNQLFATLDVTKHCGILPCNLKVLYVDTVGFISDIPNNLIESFIATFEDAIQSDLIVHVWDVSHPDSVNQRKQVWNTLKDLKFDEAQFGSMLEVGNKVDKLTEEKRMEIEATEPNMIFVSSKTGYGMNKLLNNLESATIKATQRKRLTIKVKNGGTEYNWLRKEVTVVKLEVDEANPQYCLMDVLLTDAQFLIFKSKFV